MKNLTLSLLFVLSFGISAVARPYIWFARPTICVGDTAKMFITGASTSGTWSMSTTPYVHFDYFNSIWLGVSVGTSIITYTESTGAYATASINVVAATAAITGPNAVFVDSSIHLNVSGSFTGLSPTWSSVNPGIASVSGAGLSATVTGVRVDTTIIKYNISPECNIYHTVSVNPTPCTGVPDPGIVSGSMLLCPGITERLVLSGYTTSSTTLQWQSSLDSVTWVDVPGARSSFLNDTPLVSTWYRCRVTCATSGLSAYSRSLYLPKRNVIFSHYYAMHGGILCNTVRFTVNSCHSVSGLNMVTIYGDGATDTSSVSIYGYGDTYFDHSYALSGTYTVKHILRFGAVSVDSVIYTYEHISCNTSLIKLYEDANSNCIFDSGDVYNHAPITLRIDSNHIPIDTVSVTSGLYYRAYGPAGDVYTFTILSMPPELTVTCSLSRALDITIPAFGDTIATRYFGLACSGGRPLDVVLRSNLDCFRNGASGMIYVNNNDCTPLSTTVTLQVDSNYVFNSSSILPTSVMGRTVVWNVDSISYLSGAKYIYFSLLPPDLFDITTWPVLGDTVLTVATLGAIPGDIDTANNRVRYVNTVRGSYDPNEITVSPFGPILPCTELTYSIYFENMGNDTAHNIYVMDTLSDNLDLSTMKIVDATATMNIYRFKQDGINVLKFDFPNIKLPDSSHHNLCKGSFSYKIKTKNALSDGTTIPNRAGIYFDYNEPVLTNTVVSTIGMAPLTGVDTVCLGAQILLNTLTQGGLWRSSNGNASVTSGGAVTGLAVGLDTIGYTVANACLSRTNEKTITVHSVTPSVSIGSSLPIGHPACEGSAVTLNAVTANGGPAPGYVWRKNGVVVGMLPTYSFVPVDRDSVSLLLSSNAYCRSVDTAISPAELVHVAHIYLPWVDILINSESGSDTFTAVVSNGDPSTNYQWVLNSTVLPGATTSVFSSNSLANYDSVTCMVSGSGDCSYATFNSVIIHREYTGLRSVASPSTVCVAPNPSRGVFTITGQVAPQQDGQVTIELKNALGQVVYRTTETVTKGWLRTTITLPPAIASGNYLLSVYSVSGFSNSKVVIEK